VNPNNILLDITQTPTRPVLTDFGLVKALSTGDNLTMTVGLIGTFHYYAPEQWTRATLTPATDLYALAITVFEMLAGQRPYAGDIFGLRDKHLNEALPPLSSVNADTGPFFDDVLIRATAKDPLDRYESVAEFIKALEAANLEADRDEKYRAIQALIKREDFDQALKRLDRDFIQMGQYRYRDIARLLWGVIYAQEHEGIFPPEWNGSPGNRTTPFGPTEIMSDRQEFAPGQTSEKWHSVNKYVIPLALAITMLIGSSIASQIPTWLKTPTVQITGLLLLVGYLAYYTWVYYIEPFRKVD